MPKKKTPQNSAKSKKNKKKPINPYKGKERQLYLFWSAIPAVVRRMLPEQREEIGYTTDDPVFEVIIKIKTKTQFAEEIEIDRNTLISWDKDEKFQKDLKALGDKLNVYRFSKDVDFHFIRKTIKFGDAPRVKLFKQVFEGWKEQTGLEVHGDIAVKLDKIEDEMADIAKGIKKKKD